MSEFEFIKALELDNIFLTPLQLEQLKKFYQLLISWNERINLTRIVDLKEVYLKHFYDSLTLSKIYSFTNETLCDVGSGAGFPGIVLKIVYPNLKITLVDSLNKRVLYLNEVIKELGLLDITALHSRVEDINTTFDIITVRAVAKLSKLIDICYPLMNDSTKLLIMKGNIQEELIESSKIINKKHLKIDKLLEFTLPIENSNRSLLKITK